LRILQLHSSYIEYEPMQKEIDMAEEAEKKRIRIEEVVVLFTAVEDQALVERCLQKTEQIVGDLEKPHSGVFMSWPLSSAKGLRKHSEEGKKTP